MANDADELLQVVDEHGNFLRAVPRRECHLDPSLIHRSVCVLVFDGDGQLYLQKRSANKDLYPGEWDLSATGHVRAGETPDEAAVRELREELGVEASLERLTEILLRAPEEAELTTVYRCRHDGLIRLDPTEIDDGAYYAPEDARRVPTLTGYARAILDALDPQAMRCGEI